MNEKIPALTQNDGYAIPQLGVGTYQLDDYEGCKKAMLLALDNGYRHIDTAQVYRNEEAVGAALAEAGIPREDIYLTTKVWVSNYGYEKAKRSIERSLERLKTEYVDLLLLHRPYGNYLGAWKALEEAVESGKARSIGISNFNEKQTRKILEIAKIKPTVNQIECHPYYQQKDFRDFLAKNGMLVEAWYPLGHGDKKLFEEPLFKSLALKYGKTVGQIILRWHIQVGNIVFPKAAKEGHLQENREIFDFELSAEDMEKIGVLDKGRSFFRTPEWLDSLMAKLFNKVD